MRSSSGKRPAEDSIVAFWDTTSGYTENGIATPVSDTGPNALTARGINHPVRCLTGWNWSGKNDCFRLAPGEYGGIEFHREAMTDCRWDVTKTMQIPAGAEERRLRDQADAGVRA